uniref:C2H2-type domain-containing protein n=1 Tax=Eptatretus burgeri TaxID=7764 RepID=A0A8C4QN16_EPTBU
MNRDPPNCAHHLRSSDSKSGSDGGTRGGPGGAAGICGFKILDVQNLRDGGDGTNQEPDPIVVVKVEPADDSSSQYQISPMKVGCLDGNVPLTSNSVHTVKREPCKDSDFAKRLLKNGESPRTRWSQALQTTLKQLEGRNQHRCRRNKYNQWFYTGKNTSKLDKHTNLARRRFACVACKKTFKCASHLRLNEKLHVGKHLYKCSICDKLFASRYKLKAHEMRHTDKKLFECKVCKKAFKHSSYLKMHEKIHTDDSPHKCTVCVKVFTRHSSQAT